MQIRHMQYLKHPDMNQISQNKAIRIMLRLTWFFEDNGVYSDLIDWKETKIIAIKYGCYK